MAADLMAKIHQVDYFSAFGWLSREAPQYPGLRPEHTRVAFWKGEFAGTLRLTSDTIRIGEARLRMGGFGWVTTHPEYRHKGVARELMQNTLQYMRSQQYHVSMLFGIPNFYSRFGFTSALPYYAAFVNAVDAMAVLPPPYRVRDGKPGDIQAIQRLHQLHESDVACSILRTSAHVTNRWEQWQPLRVITNDKGRVSAYFLPRRTPEHLNVIELGVLNAEACASLLHAVSKMAIEEYSMRLRFAAPPNHPFMRYLLQFKSCHEMRVARDEEGMMAFINLAETLECMIPEWENRLLETPSRNTRTEVTLIIERKPYLLRNNKGTIDVSPGVQGKNKLSLSEAELMHLMTGYRYLEDILDTHRRILDGDSRCLLAALFPKRVPFVWPIDRF